jgi:hypothetical protein
VAIDQQLPLKQAKVATQVMDADASVAAAAAQPAAAAAAFFLEQSVALDWTKPKPVVL